MNIKELLEKNSTNMLVVLTLLDLQEFVFFTMEEARKQAEEQSKMAKPDKELSQRDVLRQLGVSSSTLWRWAKDGYLVPKHLGSKVYYLQSQLDALKKG